MSVVEPTFKPKMVENRRTTCGTTQMNITYAVSPELEWTYAIESTYDSYSEYTVRLSLQRSRRSLRQRSHRVFFAVFKTKTGKRRLSSCCAHVQLLRRSLHEAKRRRWHIISAASKHRVGPARPGPVRTSWRLINSTECRRVQTTRCRRPTALMSCFCFTDWKSDDLVSLSC